MVSLTNDDEEMEEAEEEERWLKQPTLSSKMNRSDFWIPQKV